MPASTPVITVLDLNAGRANRGVAAISDLVRAAGGRTRVVDLRCDGRLPSRPGQAVILTGGPGSPAETEPWRRRLSSALPALARRVPVLGICLGFQVMASTWGWRLAPLPTPRFGVYGLQVASRPDHWLPTLPAGAGLFEQRRWAAWPRPGARGRLLATGQDGDALAVRFAPLALGVVFHPEAAAAPVARWLGDDPAARLRADRLGGPGAAAAHVARATSLDGTHAAVLPAFLRAVLERRTP